MVLVWAVLLMMMIMRIIMIMFKYILFLIAVCLSVRATDFNHTMADIKIGSININGARRGANRASVVKQFDLKKM